MSIIKTTSFTEKDKELVKKIQAYQKEKGLPHFIDAVRILCADALELKRITK